MVTVEADLNGITTSGLMQAYAALADGPCRIGDDVLLKDLFGEDCFAASVSEISEDGALLLLDVDWDSHVGVAGTNIFINCRVCDCHSGGR